MFRFRDEGGLSMVSGPQHPSEANQLVASRIALVLIWPPQDAEVEALGSSGAVVRWWPVISKRLWRRQQATACVSHAMDAYSGFRSMENYPDA